MNDLEKFNEIIIQDWGENSCSLFIFNKIFKEIKPNVSDYIPIFLLRKWLKKSDFEYTEKDLEICYKYLCNTLNLLDLNYEYTDVNDNSYDLDIEDVKQILLENSFSHPETGILMDAKNCEGVISAYLSPTNKFIEIWKLKEI